MIGFELQMPWTSDNQSDNRSLNWTNAAASQKLCPRWHSAIVSEICELFIL